MKKSLVALTVGAIAVSALAGCSVDDPASEVGGGPVRSEFSQELHDMLPDDVKASGVLSIAGETNQPWRIVGADGSVSGLGEDMFAELETVLGVDIQTELVGGLPAVKLGFQSGRNDAGAGPLLITESTLKDVTFIEYLLGRPGLVSSTDAQPLTGLLEVCGSTIAYLDGSAAWVAVFDALDVQCVEAGSPAVTRLPLADINAAVLAVESGRAQHAGVGAHQAVYTSKENPDKFTSYIATPEEWKSDHLGMGFAVDDTQLSDTMLAAWQVLFATGVYQELMAEYGLEEIAVEEPVLHVGGATA